MKMMKRIPSCILSSSSSLFSKTSVSSPLATACTLQVRHYAKPLKREHNLRAKAKAQSNPKSIHPIKRDFVRETDGWSPLDAPLPEQPYHTPSTYAAPPPTIDTSHNEAAMDALKENGFLVKLGNYKDNNWGSAFHHKYLDPNTTHIVNREMETKGHLALVAALRMYLYNKYPQLPPISAADAAKWFTSPIATARFAKFLQFDEMVYFSHDSLATKIGSEYDVYKTLQPDERVHLLASTYNTLMGIIYEKEGIKGLLPLVEVQTNWVEGLEISVITEKEPTSKTQAKKRRLAAALQQSFPQPRKRLPNWLTSALNSLYNPVVGITPKMVADRYYKLCRLGHPTYRVIRESGRLSRSALFVVGVFNENGTMLGQGFGGSIRAAEHEAAKATMEAVLAQTNDQYRVEPIKYNK